MWQRNNGQAEDDLQFRFTAYLVSAVKRRRKDYLIQLYNLRTEIDELLERVFNTFQNKVEIDLDVELAAGKPISGQSDLVFATSPFEMGEETYEIFQNLTRLTTSALQYDLAKSIGSGRSDLIFHTSTADTIKTAFDKMQNDIELLSSVDTKK